MNKKGISAVVATILIVLLTVVAVVIIWAVLKPAIQRSAGSVSTNCLEVDMNIDKVDCTVGSESVTVTLNTGKISKLKIAFYDAQGSNITTIDTGILEELETKTYTATNLPAGTLTGANVAPVIASETGEEQTCSFVQQAPKPCA